MSIKAILVPIEGIEHDIHALRGALRLAQSHDAHVTALLAQPTEDDFAVTWARYSMISPPVGLLTQIGQDARSREHAAMQLLERATREFGAPVVPGNQEQASSFSASLLVERGYLTRAVAAMAPFHDVVVLGNDPDGVDLLPLDGSLLEAALLMARCPALLVPKLPHDLVPSQVVIAWSGSIEGAQAVKSALPFLAQADNVTVLRIGETDCPEAHDRMLIDYLRLHDIPAELRIVGPSQHSTGTSLLSAATDLQADLLVMGGYTHGPLRQSMLGGVTRHVLKHAPVPVLMAH